MQNWKFHTEEFATNFRALSGTTFDTSVMTNRLNQLGADGWELVNVFGITKVKGGTKLIVAILKRPADC